MSYRSLLLVVSTLVCALPVSAGFHDPKLVTAKVRTDFNASNEGTSSNPLTYGPCLFPDSTPGLVNPGLCTGSLPTAFSNSNRYQLNGGATSSTYWVLSVNNEPAYTTVNPGPPNQSLPVVSPGYGTMGFTVLSGSLVGETFKRAHLVLNNTFSNPNGDGAIPFLGFGAEQYRGNGAAIATLNSYWQKLAFKVRLWDYRTPALSGGGYSTAANYLFLRAKWGGLDRMIFLNLMHTSNYQFSTPSSPGLAHKWNWPIQESFYYPGAAIAYMDAEDLYTHCDMSIASQSLGYRSTALPSSQQVELSYTIDLTRLFRCASDHDLFGDAASDELPSTVVDVTGVHWANEVAGPNAALWTSVHDMRIVSVFGSSISEPNTATDTDVPVDGPGVAAIRRAFEAGTCHGRECDTLASPEWREHTRHLPDMMQIPLRRLPSLLGPAPSGRQEK